MELPNIIRLDNFYTQKQYEIAGNLSVNTARNRIKSGLIAALKIDGQYLIDIVNPLQTHTTKRNNKLLMPLCPEALIKIIWCIFHPIAEEKGKHPISFFRQCFQEKYSGW